MPSIFRTVIHDCRVVAVAQNLMSGERSQSEQMRIFRLQSLKIKMFMTSSSNLPTSSSQDDVILPYLFLCLGQWVEHGEPSFSIRIIDVDSLPATRHEHFVSCIGVLPDRISHHTHVADHLEIDKLQNSLKIYISTFFRTNCDQ